jgi:hypothetical protein
MLFLFNFYKPTVLQNLQAKTCTRIQGFYYLLILISCKVQIISGEQSGTMMDEMKKMRCPRFTASHFLISIYFNLAARKERIAQGWNGSMNRT